jgi:hypothetical protein
MWSVFRRIAFAGERSIELRNSGRVEDTRINNHAGVVKPECEHLEDGFQQIPTSRVVLQVDAI